MPTLDRPLGLYPAGRRATGVRRRRWVGLCAAALLAGCADAAPRWDDQFETCRTVPVVSATDGAPIVGIEDIARADDTLVFSAYDRWAVDAAMAAGAAAVPPGGLYTVPVTDIAGADRVVATPVAIEPALRPHGIDVWAAPDGTTTVFAVDRPAQRDGVGRWVTTPNVVRFTLDGNRAVAVRRLDHPGLCRANDLAALSADRAAVTLDQTACGGPGLMLERIARPDGGRVIGVHLPQAADGQITETPDAHGFRFANGIAQLADGRLIVAESRGMRLTILDVDTGSRTAIPLPGGPDNLSLAPDGTVLAAVHPRLLVMAAYRNAVAGITRAPSRIVAIDPATGAVTTVFADPFGRLFAAASVAVWVGDDLIAGSVQDAGLLICEGRTP